MKVFDDLKLFFLGGPYSYLHNDAIVLETIKNDEFPFLISFPRTGSHWLRIIMELYFKRPSLTRIFYYKYSTDYTCYHTHDLEDNVKIGNVERKRVLYLYRNVSETVYSMLHHENKSTDDLEQIYFWSDLYKEHLKKWLIESATEQKVVLKYERLKNNLVNEFEKVTKFLGYEIEEERLIHLVSDIDKRKVKSRLTDAKGNNRVINTGDKYDDNRNIFLDKFDDLINKRIFESEPRLIPFFS